MKHCFSIKATLPLALLCAVVSATSGCAGTTNAEDINIRLHADNTSLYRAANQALRVTGVVVDNDSTTLPHLQLSETYDKNIESLARDGSVSSYQIRYTLSYQWQDKPVKQIILRQVTDHDENRYRASRNQQQQMVESLRRSALTQMIISLPLR